MATTKGTPNVFHNDVSLVASSGDLTATAWNLTDGYGAEISVDLTNGGTGPTIAAQVQIETSPDNTNWYTHGGPLVGGTGNSEVSSWGAIPIHHSVKYVRTVSGSNTGTAVVVRAEGVETEAI